MTRKPLAAAIRAGLDYGASDVLPLCDGFDSHDPANRQHIDVAKPVKFIADRSFANPEAQHASFSKSPAPPKPAGMAGLIELIDGPFLSDLKGTNVSGSV